MIAEARKRWQKFVCAFNALGVETRGMLPEAASVLLVAAVDYEKDNDKGFQPIPAGVPGFAIFSGATTVDVRFDYSGCQKFWELDLNYMRAKITDTGCEYVKKYRDIFGVLFED